MNTLDAIYSRMSVREYSDKPVSDEDLTKILKAAMSGPSCVDARDWQFLVTRDKEILNKMADNNGRPAQPLRGAALGIMVIGDLDAAFGGAPDYWIVDGSIAAQNMILAARELGIGTVWLGTYPQMNRVEALQKAFDLPKNMVPHSIISFGYPAAGELPAADRTVLEPEKIHVDKW